MDEKTNVDGVNQSHEDFTWREAVIGACRYVLPFVFWFYCRTYHIPNIEAVAGFMLLFSIATWDVKKGFFYNFFTIPVVHYIVVGLIFIGYLGLGGIYGHGNAFVILPIYAIVIAFCGRSTWRIPYALFVSIVRAAVR